MSLAIDSAQLLTEDYSPVKNFRSCRVFTYQAIALGDMLTRVTALVTAGNHNN